MLLLLLLLLLQQLLWLQCQVHQAALLVLQQLHQAALLVLQLQGRWSAAYNAISWHQKRHRRHSLQPAITPYLQDHGL